MRIHFNFLRGSCPNVAFHGAWWQASTGRFLLSKCSLSLYDFCLGGQEVMHNTLCEEVRSVRKLVTGNLPGWRWARIKQLVLVGLSSSLHSEACNALGALLGSPTAKFVPATISVRAVVNYILDKCLKERYEFFVILSCNDCLMT